IPSITGCKINRQPARLREEELVLLDQLFVRGHGLDVVARIVDDPLRVHRRRTNHTDHSDQTPSHGGSPHCTPPIVSSYAGSSRSLVRYTLIRNPSRVVTVGSRFKYRSSTR